MREIKFRGTNFVGNTYYGGYFKNEIGTSYIITSENLYYGYLTYHSVVDETVAQFIATDKNGKDIYEGDKVFYPDGGFVEPNTGDWIHCDKPFEAWLGNVDDICNGDLILAEEK